MSDDERKNYDGEWVEVETGHDPDTAVLLLDAAEKAGMPVEWVRTTGSGFLVPKEVADHAGVDYGKDDDQADTGEQAPEAKSTPKKKAPGSAR